MSNAVNPAAPHFLPSFITAPGETDYLFYGVAAFLVVLVFLLGSMYFWLHSIPERISHGASKIQFQLVAVLSLLALFTHNNAFWVGALLLALVPIPDFWTPLAEMAESLARMAGQRLRGTTDGLHTTAHQEDAAASPSSLHAEATSVGPREGTGTTPHAAVNSASTPAVPAAAEDGGPPLSSGGTAVAAKAGGGRRRVMSREGA